MPVEKLVNGLRNGVESAIKRRSDPKATHFSHKLVVQSGPHADQATEVVLQPVRHGHVVGVEGPKGLVPPEEYGLALCVLTNPVQLA